MPKKIPIRQCVACRGHFEKPTLARIVRTKDGEIVFDAKGKVSGRGAYLCKKSECFERSIKTRALNRALETEIPEEAIEVLRRHVKEAEDG